MLLEGGMGIRDRWLGKGVGVGFVVFGGSGRCGSTFPWRSQEEKKEKDVSVFLYANCIVV